MLHMHPFFLRPHIFLDVFALLELAIKQSALYTAYIRLLSFHVNVDLFTLSLQLLSEGKRPAFCI